MANEKRLIDANSLRGKMQKYVFPITTNNLMGAADAYYRILHLLDDAPTVDAEPVVHGYWIDSTTVNHAGRIAGYGIDCSVCDSVFKDDSREVVQHWKEEFKMCPFCGAVMDGGDEDG